MKSIVRNVAYPVTSYSLRDWARLYAWAAFAQLVAAPVCAVVYVAERLARRGGR